jgi:hypothetical protein
MNQDEIKAARERCESATEGPWRVARYDGCHVLVPDGTVRDSGGKLDYGGGVMCHDIREADAEFIAHARTDLPRALDEIGRLSARVSEITGENNEFWSATWCPECGPDVKVDEDGCCTMCGCTAMGVGVECVGFMAKERDRLRTDNERLRDRLLARVRELEDNEKERKRYKATLEQYADQENWTSDRCGDADVWELGEGFEFAQGALKEFAS